MSLIPDEVEVDLFVLVDNAYNNLVRWQEWEDGYEPVDAGETISAYTMMGTLSAIQALLEQGVNLPYHWVMDQVDSVNERIVMSIPDVPSTGFSKD
jgi:ABC-type sulfate transport system permease component